MKALVSAVKTIIVFVALQIAGHYSSSDDDMAGEIPA